MQAGRCFQLLSPPARTARHGVSNTPEHSNDIYRHRGMAASNPLHRDASASRQPSTHSLHCFTACNAALPSHKIEGLVGPLRPLSGSRSCGRPPRPRPLPFAHASHADARTKTTACARAVRVRCCPRICQATTMRRTAGIKNNIGTRVERREKLSNSLPPQLALKSKFSGQIGVLSFKLTLKRPDQRDTHSSPRPNIVSHHSGRSRNPYAPPQA